MSSRDWIIVIPSYKRQDIIMEKSLATLKRYHVPPSKIVIFVANQEEKKLYEEAIPKGTVKEIIVGLPGLDKVRNYILDYYPKGKHLVMMDDDIRGFHQRTKDGKLEPLDNLISLIDTGFSVAETEKCSLWGIYPVDNGFFMSDTISTDLKFIIGCFFGLINTKAHKDPNGIIAPLPVKEDYMRTLDAYNRDGKVIRFNFVCAVSSIYQQQGGQDARKRLVREKTAVNYLLKHYPDNVSLNEHRKSGFPEIRLKGN